MSKPGPSPEYRELLKGRITADEYVKRLKKAVDDRLQREHRESRSKNSAAAA